MAWPKEMKVKTQIQVGWPQGRRQARWAFGRPRAYAAGVETGMSQTAAEKSKCYRVSYTLSEEKLEKLVSAILWTVTESQHHDAIQGW